MDQTRKNIFVVNLSAFYYTHSLKGLKFMAKMELIFLSRSNRQSARTQRIFRAVGLNCRSETTNATKILQRFKRLSK